MYGSGGDVGIGSLGRARQAHLDVIGLRFPDAHPFRRVFGRPLLGVGINPTDERDDAVCEGDTDLVGLDARASHFSSSSTSRWICSSVLVIVGADMGASLSGSCHACWRGQSSVVAPDCSHPTATSKHVDAPMHAWTQHEAYPRLLCPSVRW